MAFSTPARINGLRSPPSMSQSMRSEHDGAPGSPLARRFAGRSAKSGTISSASSNHMADTVKSLKRRCAERLGSAAAAKVVCKFEHLVERISNERLRRLPTEGSAWDKVLAWAQAFAEKIHDFDSAIEQFTGGDYDGAEIAFGYCILLLELGEDNARALQASFGFFFQRSIQLIALLDRAELFGVSTNITDELIFAYADLVTLVSEVALSFYESIRAGGDKQPVDIYTSFATTIESFESRRNRTVELMWTYQLMNENMDTNKIAKINTLRSWLAVSDSVLKHSIAEHTSLCTERQALTCLWIQPYLARFLNSTRDSLVITGGEGSGKSVLAATIVDVLQKTATKKSYNIIFVPIDARVSVSVSGIHVASQILLQLLDNRVGNVQLYKVVADAYNSCRTTKESEKYEELLWDAVDNALQCSLRGGKDTLLIIDGLDEISDDSSRCQTLLKRLQDAAAQHVSVKLIATTQSKALAPNTKADVDITSDLISDDIFIVVTELLKKSPHFNSRNQMDRDILVENIVTASKGSFLWAKLVTKSLVTESSTDKLTKAVDSIKKSPKSIQDVIKDLMTTSNVTDDGRLLTYWLTVAERPLTVEELACIYQSDPKKGTVNDNRLNVTQILSPMATLVFLQAGLLYLRHRVIRQTLTTWFEQKPPTKEPGSDFLLRLLTYLKSNVKDQKEPSFSFVSESQVEQRFEQDILLEYVVRYWPAHYLSLPSKVRDDSPDFKKDLTNILPMSPVVALIEKCTWTWAPTPLRVTWHTTSTSLRRKILNNDNHIVLQSIIDMATMYESIDDRSSAAINFYQATISSCKVYNTTHQLTIQCANHFLAVTGSMSFTTRTDIVTYREEILVILIDSYTKLYGATSELVMAQQRLLIELYRSVKEEQKAVDIESRGKETSTTTDKTTTGGSRDTGSKNRVIISGRRKDDDIEEWDFSEVEHDSIINIEIWNRIDELLKLAASCASKNETVKAEQDYVEAWYLISTHTTATSSIETHVKKIDVAIAYASFLKSTKRESEAAAVLVSVWEEYRSMTISRTEQINVKLIEVGKLLKSLGLTSIALVIFKHCTSVYRSLNKTDGPTYKDCQEHEQSTHRDLMKEASSSPSSASQLSETAIAELFAYLESSKTTELDTTSTSAIKQVIKGYMLQHRYKDATHLLKRTLRSIWPSMFTASIEDVTQPTSNKDFAYEMMEELIVCQRLRHRPAKVLEYREKLYRALKQTRKIDDKVVQYNITELFKIYDQLRMSEKTIQLHRELLEEYKKFYGPSHNEVIKTLYTLAKLTSPEPVSVEYYRQIVNILNKDSDTCHPDAIEPLKIVGAHYWNEKRYPGSVWAYSMLFRTFTSKGKDIKAFQDTTFVAMIYNRYVDSLRATSTDITTIYQISTQYRNTCSKIFGPKAKVTIEATMYLARICEHSKKYQQEGITLYEQLLKESAASEYHAEIRQILEVIYEEQALEAARSVKMTASDDQIDRAVTVIRTRTTKNRSDYGWAHHESLAQLKELAYLLFKRNKKDDALKELNEATRQIVTKETYAETLVRSATTIAESYMAINETHKGLELAEEMRWQLVTKDNTNAKKVGVDVTNCNRSVAIFIAQLQYCLLQDTSITFNSIYMSILTEVVYYDEFQRSVKSNAALDIVFAIAARLHSFLIQHQRTALKTRVENELIRFFMKSAGEKSSVGDEATVKVLVLAMLQYVETHDIKDFAHSVNLASIKQIRYLLSKGEQQQACHLAQTAFRYVNAVKGYKNTIMIKYGLILAITIADLDNKNPKDASLQKQQAHIAAEIIVTVLKAAQSCNMNLAGIPTTQVNAFVIILGTENDYNTLEWLLTILWNARESRSWKASVVLELGYRLVLARFLLGKYEPAIKLATDIAYNLRRVYGAINLATLEVNVLLGQLCISTGLAYQSKKGAEEIARRYYKRAITVHESVLRSLTLDLDGADDDDTMSILSMETEPINWSVIHGSNASEGTYARKHLVLLKLALERYGGYPKGITEYEAINEDVFKMYADECKGVDPVSKWTPEKYGNGKAESDEGCLDTNVSKWSLIDNVSTGTAESAAAKSNGVTSSDSSTSKPKMNGGSVAIKSE